MITLFKLNKSLVKVKCNIKGLSLNRLRSFQSLKTLQPVLNEYTYTYAHMYM